jgi:hypothetical protein
VIHRGANIPTVVSYRVNTRTYNPRTGSIRVHKLVNAAGFGDSIRIEKEQELPFGDGCTTVSCRRKTYVTARLNELDSRVFPLQHLEPWGRGTIINDNNLDNAELALH